MDTTYANPNTTGADMFGQPDSASALAFLERVQSDEELSRLIPAEQVGQVAMVLARLEQAETVTANTFTEMLAVVDEKMDEQLDAILHAPEFVKIESTWAGLKLIYDRAAALRDRGVEVDVLHATKEELTEDFVDGVTDSQTFRKVYSEHLGKHGGNPYGTIVSGFEFGLNAGDLALLKNLGAVGRISHAPFVANAESSLIGFDTIREATIPQSLTDQLENTAKTDIGSKWASFRASDDARYVVLTTPRILAREPYDPKTNAARGVNYTETVTSDDQLAWTAAAYGLGANMAQSFAEYGWCISIADVASGGRLRDLAMFHLPDSPHARPPLSLEAEFAHNAKKNLADAGIAVLDQQPWRNEAFFSAVPTYRAKRDFPKTPEGEADARSDGYGIQLPYVMVASRIAHHLKVMFEDKIGSTISMEQAQTMMNKWLAGITAHSLPEDPELAERKPLKSSSVSIRPSREPGMYEVDLKIEPHARFVGMQVKLALTSKIKGESGAAQ